MLAGSLDPRGSRAVSRPSLVCRQVTKRREGATLLEGLELSISRGEFVVISGPSRSGKSMLLDMLAGHEAASEGQVLFEGIDLGVLAEGEASRLRRGSMGFLYANARLIGTLNARGNVLLPLELRGVADADVRCHEELSRVGLAADARLYPAELSEEQQRTVAMARAFAARPRVVFADDPLLDLGPAASERLLSTLLMLRALHGTTLVLATSDQAVARRADRHLRLVAGRLVDC